MGSFITAIELLPEEMACSLRRVSAENMRKVQEIRLRRDGFLALSLGNHEKTVDMGGVLSDVSGPSTVYCTANDIEKTFLKACEYSVHSHMEELREGFVTAKGGVRVGVAGTVVSENGRVSGIREISSLCIRVAGRHDGCAEPLRGLFTERMPSVLIAGEPSSGKTSLLRDVARMLSLPPFCRRVSVIDERGEIAGLGGLENTDVLTFVPKPKGILQAVRTLAPDVILVDELGTLDEVEAMTENLHAGVPTVATAHCRNLEEALRRQAIRLALQRDIFEKIVFLEGRGAAGRIREVVEVSELEMVGFSDVDGGRYAVRSGCSTAKATEGGYADCCRDGIA